MDALSGACGAIYGKPDERIPAGEYKVLKLELLQVAADLCRHGDTQCSSPTQYHDWIAQYRIFFRLDTILREKTVEQALADTPQLFLHSMRLMNSAFEGSGRKTFALVPLTTTMRPGFISFDTSSIGEVLGVGRTEGTKKRNNAAAAKRREVLAGERGSLSCGLWR